MPKPYVRRQHIPVLHVVAEGWQLELRLLQVHALRPSSPVSADALLVRRVVVADGPDYPDCVALGVENHHCLPIKIICCGSQTVADLQQ